MKQAYDKWPDQDWYCYLEYDCLVVSDSFKSDLKKFEKLNYWVLGTDLRLKKCKIPFVERIIGKKFNETFHMLGCFYFLHRDYLSALNDLNFFDKFLSVTNYFSTGFYPRESFWKSDAPEEFDIAEELVPTLAYYLGGKIGSLSLWGDGSTHPHMNVLGNFNIPATGKYVAEGWYGNYRKYPIRWKPDLNENENFIEAAIMHPLKDYDHPIRQYHKWRRDSDFIETCSDYVEIDIYPSFLDINWFNLNGIFNSSVKDETGRLWVMRGNGKEVNSLSTFGPFDFSF